MDDLISRKSVAKKMQYRRDYVGRPSDPDCIIADEPSVPAVPLDKLCEFLEKCGADSYCRTCKQIMGECFADGRECGSEHFWKELLTKWMEGLDGSESMV